MIKHKSYRSWCTKTTSTFIEIASNICNCSCVIICCCFNNHCNSIGCITFKKNLFVISLIFIAGSFNCSLNIVFRHIDSFSILYYSSQFRIVFCIWSTFFYSHYNVFTNSSECFTHCCPPFHFPGLSKLKCSSHCNNLML